MNLVFAAGSVIDSGDGLAIGLVITLVTVILGAAGAVWRWVTSSNERQDKNAKALELEIIKLDKHITARLHEHDKRLWVLESRRPSQAGTSDVYEIPKVPR